MDLEVLIGRLSLEVKVRLLTGASAFGLHGEESIGLAPMTFSDGPAGVRGPELVGGPVTALLPNASLLAATWSRERLLQTGRIIAEEAARQGVHVVLGPTINLHRTPLGGRLFEAFSEDPLLTGLLAAAYVEGVQSQGIGSCLKHLVANEAETERHSADSVVDQRTLREVYLLPFEIAIADADPWTVMSAYNRVNGVPATEHAEINLGVLRDDWGWPGLLVSDWFATQRTVESVTGGLDLVMPGPDGPWGQALVAAVRAGEVAETVVDDHLRRLLLLAARVGALRDDGSAREWPEVVAPDSAVRRAQLTELACAGMTVLKNDDEVLPLRPADAVALIGRPAVETQCLGGGSSTVRAPHRVSVAEGLAALAPGLVARVTVAAGVAVREQPRPARPPMVTVPGSDVAGVLARTYDAAGRLLRESVVDDGLFVADPTVPGFGELPARLELSAVVPAGELSLGVIGVGEWEVDLPDAGGGTEGVALRAATDDQAEAILRPPGWSRPVALAEPAVVTATVRLPGPGAFGLVAEAAWPADPVAIDAAVAAARECDVAVVVVGLTEEQETESLDKHTLRLPGRQDELVSAVAAAARRTVVVVNAATPVLMPWLDEVDAVLWVGLPGQEAGHAVAAALVGELEPSGRLVTSFPAADGQSPAWDVVPSAGRMVYAEGAFVGYRGFAGGLAAPPLFWFGHGLGYGSWRYDAARVAGDEVTVTITNTSARRSREVVQVYLDPLGGEHPVRLVGWATAELPPGATTDVTVRCDPRACRTWDDATHSWLPFARGELLVARGLGDVRGVLVYQVM